MCNTTSIYSNQYFCFELCYSIWNLFKSYFPCIKICHSISNLFKSCHFGSMYSFAQSTCLSKIFFESQIHSTKSTQFQKSLCIRDPFKTRPLEFQWFMLLSNIPLHPKSIQISFLRFKCTFALASHSNQALYNPNVYMPLQITWNNHF